MALRHRVRGGAWPLAAWLAASALIGVSTFSRVDSPTLFPQTYDTIFHLSGALWILDTGDASSLDFRAIIEPGSASFYPSAWHSLVALVSSLTSWTGVASPNSWAVLVPAAMNASWLAVCGVLWLPGIAWMTRVALPARWCGGEAGIRWLGPLAVLLGAGFVAMPFATLSFGSLYPMFLAYAATPALVGLVVVLARRWWPAAAPGGDAGPDTPAGPDAAAGPGANPAPRVASSLLVVVAVLAGLAVAFAQPRALPSGALIAGFFLLSTAVHALRLAWVRGGRSRRRAVTWVSVVLAAAVLLLAAAWLVIYHAFDVANRPVSDHLNGPQATATMTFWQALLGVLAQLPRLGTDGPGIPAVLLGLTLSVGIVWCLRVRAVRWLAASGLASVLLYALAAGSNSVFAKLATGIWYKDAFRLAAMVALVGVPLVAFVLARCVAACRGAAAGWVRVGVPVLAAVLVVGSGWVAVVSSVPSAMGKVFALTDSAKADGGRLRDARQAAFLERVGDIVPAGERVLGDPWDGSTLVWLYGGREPVFPHVNGRGMLTAPFS